MMAPNKPLWQSMPFLLFCCIVPLSGTAGQVARSARIGSFGLGVGDRPTATVTAKPGMVEIQAGPLIRGQFSPDAVRLWVDSLRDLIKLTVRDRAGERAEIEGPELHALFGGAVEVHSARSRDNRQDIYSLSFMDSSDQAVGVYRAPKFTVILALLIRAATKADAMRDDPE